MSDYRRRVQAPGSAEDRQGGTQGNQGRYTEGTFPLFKDFKGFQGGKQGPKAATPMLLRGAWALLLLLALLLMAAPSSGQNISQEIK